MHISERLQKILKGCVLVFGLAFFTIGLALLMAVPIFVAREIAKEDHLGTDKNGTDNLVLQSFRNPQYSMLLEVWTFSVQNAQKIIGGARPVVVEKGPYVFVESQAKKFLEFANNNTRVLYRNTRAYHYSTQLSCKECSLSDRVVVPNVIFQKLVDIALLGETKRFFIEEALKTRGESAFIDVAVGELLFDGYKDPLVSSICDHLLVRSVCAAAGIPERVGLLYKQNNTDDGLYEIDAGVDSVYKLGKLYSWNNMAELPNTAWYGVQARISVEMEQSEYAEVYELPAYKYIPAKSMNLVAVQRAKGFCNPASPRFFNDTNVQEDGCSPAGLLEVSSVVPGNPRIYISQSHFYNSPKQLVESIVGLAQPSLQNDESFVSIEPLSGVILNAVRRSQLNVGVIKGNLRTFANMKDAIVPIVWINETAVVDAGTKAQVMRAVYVMHITYVWGIILTGLGIMLLLTFAGVLVYTKFIHKTAQNISYDPLGNDTDSTSSNVHPTPNSTAAQQQRIQETAVVTHPVPQM